AATIRRGVRAGVFPPRSGRRLTLAAWALVHGLVSLELDGKLPPGSRPAADYQAILRATVTGWQHEPTVTRRPPPWLPSHRDSHMRHTILIGAAPATCNKSGNGRPLGGSARGYQPFIALLA